MQDLCNKFIIDQQVKLLRAYELCGSGKAEFNLIDLSRFTKVRIGGTHVIDSTFINVIWKRRINAFEKFEKEETPIEKKIAQLEKESVTQLIKTAKLRTEIDVSAYYAKQREIYRQLKYAMNRQGDLINEQRFHALEMDVYDKSLLWSTSRWTKMILKLSRWTSDYGQSVIKPIVWLLVVHFVLFSILVAFSYFPELHFSISPNWQGMKDGWNYYFETINPFRKVESGSSFVFIDLLMRIWSSYMTYNFIRASRRLIK